MQLARALADRKEIFAGAGRLQQRQFSISVPRALPAEFPERSLPEISTETLGLNPVIGRHLTHEGR